MKSYYRTTTTIEHPSFPDGYKTECFSQRFVDDLHNMDIISHYTKDEEPRDDEYKKFRKMLSLLVAISFLISSAYWINPYSNPLT